MAILETVRKLAKKKDASPPEKVDTTGRIDAIISSIAKERKTLEIGVDERMQFFSSSGIIEAGNFKGKPSLVIDTLIPKLEGIRALENSTRLEIGFRLNEVPHTFISKFYTMSEDTSPTVTIAYPGVIYIHQFRGAYRIIPGMSDGIYVDVEFTDVKKKEREEEASGSDENEEENQNIRQLQNIVEDLSMEGLAFLTKNPDLTKGKEVLVDFEVPGAGHFKTRALVKNLIRMENPKYPFKCGIQFEDLTRPEKERIYRFIMEKQREAIKKKQGLI